MKVRLFYRDLDSMEEEHPVDRLVEERVGTRKTRRKLAKLSDAIVRALGLGSKHLWFDYEQSKGEFDNTRDATYFDIGVEHGLAAAHANEIAEPRQRVRTLAQHLLREAMASGLDPEDASAAAALATWSLLGRLHITRQRRGGPR